jgi:hypothetical protein
MIDGEGIERAEKMIMALFSAGIWPDSALEYFEIDESAFSNFIKHSLGRIRELYPDIDPRHDAAIATMFTHQTLVGVAMGRAVGYSEDAGLNT